MSVQLALRSKIEIICDQPLVRRVIAIANGIGVRHHTVIPALSGHGDAGPWSDDQLSAASAKVMICLVMNGEAAELLIAQLEPVLNSHSIRVWVSEVQVLRPERY